MKTILSNTFRDAKKKLRRRGGISQLVYEDVVVAIDRWNNGLPDSLRVTDHGETRIKHCVKYKLRDGHRLVTVQHKGARMILFVGKHDDTHQWLESHKNYEFAIDQRGRVEFVNLSQVDVEEIDLDSASPFAVGRVLDRLGEEYVGRLGLSVALSKKLQRLTFESLEDEETWEDLDLYTYESPDQKGTVLNVLNVLRQGDDANARMIIDVYAQEAVLAAESPESLIDAVDQGTATDQLIDATEMSRRELEETFRKLEYKEWLLYLNPEQTKYVDETCNGPARIVGVSGSGKTCVLVHRARALARRYPGEKILILVLNTTLVNLLENLIGELCNEEEVAQIKCMRIYDYCYRSVKKTNPTLLIEKSDPASGEDMEDCRREFTEQRDGKFKEMIKTILQPLQMKKVDAWEYLHDEFIWIRTGFSNQKRGEYLQCDRTGRGISFPLTPEGMTTYGQGQSTNTGFPSDTRHRVKALLSRWEEYMDAGGLMDEDGVALLASEVSGEVSKHPELRARCVLVDEVQDCSTTQLSVISKIPTEQENGLFLVGDPVQKVFPKQQSLKAAGIDVRGRSYRLRTNYRNTKQVLQAAYQIIEAFRGKCPVSEEDILLPEFAVRDGPKPKLIKCDDERQQKACLVKHVSEVLATNAGTSCVAAIKDSSLPSVQHEIEKKKGMFNADWQCRKLTDKSTLSELEKSVMLSQFDDMKGHEFDFVYLMDLGEKALRLGSVPKEERWRIAFQIYVAMTRSQDELFLFYKGTPSHLIEPILPYVIEINAGDFLAE